MSNYPVGRRPGSADPHSTFRIAALTAVAAGVVLLAAAAFVLSYSGIHQIALQAGVSPDLAKLYPVIFDAMLVVAGAAAMALRGAGWWSRFYAWACLIVLLVAVAAGGAVHATGTALPERATRAALAITPWVLLLLAFGLMLTMLSHFRKTRAAVAARQEARAAAAGLAGTGGQPAEANGSAQARAPVTWTTPAMAGTASGAATGLVGTAAGMTGAGAGTAGTAAAAEAHSPPPARFGLDFWLGPRASAAPTVEAPHGADATDTGDDVSHSDPVSYGEETGYVHPDSYRDEGEYSPHGDSGGPGVDTDSGHDGQDAPTGDGEHTPQDGSTADNGEGERPADAEAPAAQADPEAHAGQADPEAQAGQADAEAPAGQADAQAPAGQADAEAQAEQADSQAPAGQADAQAPAGQGDAGAPAGQADAQARAGQADAAPNGKPASEEASAGPAGKEAPAGEDAKDEAGEPVGAKGPVLERLRSTPTRP